MNYLNKEKKRTLKILTFLNKEIKKEHWIFNSPKKGDLNYENKNSLILGEVSQFLNSLNSFIHLLREFN